MSYTTMVLEYVNRGSRWYNRVLEYHRRRHQRVTKYEDCQGRWYFLRSNMSIANRGTESTQTAILGGGCPVQYAWSDAGPYQL